MKRIFLILFSAVLLVGCSTGTGVSDRNCEIVGNREPPLLVCEPDAS